MPRAKCGFIDVPSGTSGRQLLVYRGPSLLVDIGFDGQFQPQPGLVPKPAAQGLWALVDTGATESCIDGKLAAQLGLPVIDKRRIAGVGGLKEVNVHLAHIHVPALAFTVYGQFAAVDLLAGGQQHCALIGRTFLQRERAATLTVGRALQWAQQDPSLQLATHALRLSMVRGFARYYRAIDPRTEVQPTSLLPYRPKRARPYLYTEAEVRRLLDAALGLSPEDALRRWVYYTLIGLLAVSGLRIEEALDLRLADVDLDSGVLTIRGAKFEQSRLVPLHPSSQKQLIAYPQ